MSSVGNNDFASLVFSPFPNGNNSSRKEFAPSVNKKKKKKKTKKKKKKKKKKNYFSVKQEKRLKALWTGFLNNEESVSLAWETPTGPSLYPYQIWKQSTEE